MALIFSCAVLGLYWDMVCGPNVLVYQVPKAVMRLGSFQLHLDGYKPREAVSLLGSAAL